MEIEWIVSFDVFLNLEKQWNECVKNSNVNAVFVTHQWIRCWWEAFHNDAKLKILIIREGKTIVGIAPMMLEITKLRVFPVQVLKFISNAITPRMRFIYNDSHPGVLEIIVKSIWDISTEWDMLFLNNVLEGEDALLLQKILKKQRISFYTTYARQSPYLKIEGEYSELLASRRSKFRSNIKRAIKKLEAMGNYRIEKITSPVAIGKNLLKAFEVSSKSWKGSSATDMASTENSRRFYTSFSKIGAKNGWVIIWFLYIDTEIIAMQYHTNYCEGTISLRTDYDEKYRECSPGVILDALIIEDYFKTGIREFDLSGMDYFHKKRWVDSVRKHQDFHIFNNNFSSKMIYHIKKTLLLLRKHYYLIFAKSKNYFLHK